MNLVAVLSVLLLTPCVPVDAPKEFPFLAGLTVPGDRLPKDCRPTDKPPGGRWDGLRNLELTTNPRLFIIGDRLRKVLDRTTIQAAYCGLYSESTNPGDPRKDLGIFGWAFHSEAAAKEAQAKLAEFYKRESANMRLWRINEHVVLLWRDRGTTDACFTALAKFVQERVERA